MSEMYDNDQRTSFFKKNDDLEVALTDLNNLISTVNCEVEFSQPERPVVLLMGCPRAGSTLMLQWLASLGVFSYPSNLIARFYKNPFIGIRAQQSLLELDPLNQLGFKENTNNFTSELGKTQGALSPSEFWYFWREYFEFGDISRMDADQLKKVNRERFLNQIGAFEFLMGKPLAMKGMMLYDHIPFLYSLNKNFVFVDLRRDLFFNAQSLIFAREQYFDDRKKWYSFKPQEYNTLKDKGPTEQVAGQVYYIRNSIDNGLSQIPETNQLSIDYSEFCSNPKSLLLNIKSKFAQLGFNLDIDKLDTSLFAPFESKESNKLCQDETTLLKDELLRLQGHE